METVKEEVYARLAQMGIAFAATEHAPVHTMEDCKAAEAALGGRMPKNLFLAPRNQSAFYLMLTPPEAPFRTAEISRRIGSSRLSFGSESMLLELLRTRPGAISPMGLLFDRERRVRLAVDRALCKEARLLFHPCVNTATLAMSREDFFARYLPALGVEPVYVDAHREGEA